MGCRLLPLLLLLAPAGCGSPAEPSPPRGDRVLIRPVAIESLLVTVNGAGPALVEASIRGELGDGCSELLPERQSRDGNRIRIAIESTRPADAVCTQQLKPFVLHVALDGRLDSGRYTLSVNQREIEFSVL